MFSKKYIEMCKAGKEEIELFRMLEQFQTEQIITPKPIFKPDDYFHHESMGEDKTKTVKEVRYFSLIKAKDLRSYPYEECFWIPTIKQIKESLNNMVWSIGDTSKFRYGEDILTRYMNSKGKSWSKKSKKWIKISRA